MTRILSFKNIYTIHRFDTNKSNNVLLSQIPPAVLAGSHHGVGAFLEAALLFLNIMATKSGFIEAVHAGPTVRSQAARTLPTGPEFVFPCRTCHQ